MTEHYTTGQWHGKLTCYHCNYCRFDSFDEREIINHVNRDHLSSFSVRPAEGGLVTESGETMNVVEEVPPDYPPAYNGSEDMADLEKNESESMNDQTESDQVNGGNQGSSGFRGIFNKE